MLINNWMCKICSRRSELKLSSLSEQERWVNFLQKPVINEFGPWITSDLDALRTSVLLRDLCTFSRPYSLESLALLGDRGSSREPRIHFGTSDLLEDLGFILRPGSTLGPRSLGDLGFCSFLNSECSLCSCIFMFCSFVFIYLIFLLSVNWNQNWLFVIHVLLELLIEDRNYSSIWPLEIL